MESQLSGAFPKVLSAGPENDDADAERFHISREFPDLFLDPFIARFRFHQPDFEHAQFGIHNCDQWRTILCFSVFHTIILCFTAG
ncbi:MAG: hypothetical protein IKQ92_03120 [Clostridia bacterium]|nr:hypothetical protein [Clostridia bacterium]